MQPLAHRISTPTLLVHGEIDALVPVEQTRQLHTYLRLLGVPTELVPLPGEGHGIVHPSRRSELAETVLAWIDRWMAG